MAVTEIRNSQRNLKASNEKLLLKSAARAPDIEQSFREITHTKIRQSDLTNPKYRHELPLRVSAGLSPASPESTQSSICRRLNNHESNL
jgi:phage baseplate assembly protein W